MTVTKKKKIIVTSKGAIRTLGGIEGPVMKPFEADTDTIARLLAESKIVYEVGPNGERVMLHRTNLNTVNFDPATGHSNVTGRAKEIANMQETLAVISSKKSKFQVRTSGSDFTR